MANRIKKRVGVWVRAVRGPAIKHAESFGRVTPQRIKRAEAEGVKEVSKLPQEEVLLVTPQGMFLGRTLRDPKAAENIMQSHHETAGKEVMESFVRRCSKNALRAIGVNDPERRARIIDLFVQNYYWEQQFLGMVPHADKQMSAGRLRQLQDKLRNELGRTRFMLFVKFYRKWSNKLGSQMLKMAASMERPTIND